MKEEIAKRWIEELRSGRHRQAKEELLTPDGAMCCLGVLQCEVLKLPVVFNCWLERGAMNMAGIRGSEKGRLPKAVDGHFTLSGLKGGSALRAFLQEVADDEKWQPRD